MRLFLATLLISFCATISAQTPNYDDLVFDEDEIAGPFKPASKTFATIKSKKGAGGMQKVPEVDAIKTAEISEIVLVFTETTEDAYDKREDNNRERWENLMAVYPELFQFSTSYKNVCQCVMGGDAEPLKSSQGFYIYYKVAAPKVAAATTPVKEEVKEVANTNNSASNKEAKESKKEEIKKEETVKAVKEEKKEEKKEIKEEKKTVVKAKEEEKEEDLSNETTDAPKVTSTIEVAAKKKPGFTKPKKSKDPKACRPPFYGTGDEDLHNFFLTNITLSKKQRRQIKGDISILKLSLNFDGSIKKAMVNGANPALNEMVTVAVKSMDSWNPAVKAGTTVKSEVKISLKYDKAAKGIKPLEIAITPRPNPKCTKCLSDAEIFGD